MRHRIEWGSGVWFDVEEYIMEVCVGVDLCLSLDGTFTMVDIIKRFIMIGYKPYDVKSVD